MVWFLTLSTWVQNDPHASSSFDVLFFLVYRHVYILCWTCLGILQFSYPFGRRLLQTQWQKRNQPMRQINLQRTVELACHDMLWGYILKHHETYCIFFMFFSMFQGCQYNQLTFGDGQRRVKSDGTWLNLTVSYSIIFCLVIWFDFLHCLHGFKMIHMLPVVLMCYFFLSIDMFTSCVEHVWAFCNSPTLSVGDCCKHSGRNGTSRCDR